MAIKIKQFKAKTPVFHDVFVEGNLVYLKNTLVTIPVSGGLQVSKDATTWTSMGGTGIGGDVTAELVWSNTDKLLLASDTQSPFSIFSTKDAVTYSVPLSGMTGSAQAMVYEPSLNLYVALCSNTTGTRGYTSSDGANWSSSFTVPSKQWQSVKYNGTRFSAISSDSTVKRPLYSSDGSSWSLGTTFSAGATPVLYDLIWVSSLSLFIAVGDDIYTSSDGITYTKATIPANAINMTFQGIAWSPSLNLLCAVSYSSDQTDTCTVMTSPDAVTWTLQSSPIRNAASSPYEWRSIVWSERLGIFIVPSSNLNILMYSPTGLSWSLGASGANFPAYKIISI